MFFTKAGKIMAWYLVVAGTSTIAFGLLVRYGGDPAIGATLLKGRSAGSAINAGTDWLLMCLGLGILTEISRSVVARSNREDS